ncbi:hypothetical protein ACFVDQ_43225 [Streptomyces sp. NPDC057684]
MLRVEQRRDEHHLDRPPEAQRIAPTPTVTGRTELWREQQFLALGVFGRP